MEIISDCNRIDSIDLFSIFSLVKTIKINPTKINTPAISSEK